MPTSPEAIIAAIMDEAATAGFRGRLIARGQARAMIWRDGVLPPGAPAFSPQLSFDLHSYAYGLLGLGLRLLELGGDPNQARDRIRTGGNRARGGYGQRQSCRGGSRLPFRYGGGELSSRASVGPCLFAPRGRRGRREFLPHRTGTRAVDASRHHRAAGTSVRLPPGRPRIGRDHCGALPAAPRRAGGRRRAGARWAGLPLRGPRSSADRCILRRLRHVPARAGSRRASPRGPCDCAASREVSTSAQS